jgi:hypothetical protein
MFALLSRALARAAVVAVVVAVSVVVLAGIGMFAADTASAKPIFLGHHSRGEIMGACAAAGGDYQDNGKSGSSAEYSCVTKKGTVACGSGENCGGDCQKCADILRKQGGVTPPRGGTAASASAHSLPAGVKLKHAPVHRIAAASRHAAHLH